MKSFILISASLLCSFSWISVSESQSVDVQPGEDVTLQCSNESHYDPLTFWFRLVDRATVRCIGFLPRSVSKPWFCNGYHKGSTDVTTNISTVFLKIKNVIISDSGMYFCGFYSHGNMNISVIHLNVQEDADEKPEVMKVILVGLTVFLAMGMPIIITCLIFVIKNLDSDDLNYTSVMFNPAASRRRELEPNGVFAATS